MKIVYLSNYFNHHQKPLCDSLSRLTNRGFLFVETMEIPQARRALGYGMETVPDYVKQYGFGAKQDDFCQKAIDDADAVLLGSAPWRLIRPRLRFGKLTLLYSERLFKKPCCAAAIPLRRLKYRLKYHPSKEMYLLAAGAYVKEDYAKLGLFRERSYKWGYFPEVTEEASEQLLAKKGAAGVPVLLWAGRMIPWKHPEAAIAAAEQLKASGIPFVLNMIGTGVIEQALRTTTKTLGLEDCVRILGPMKPEQVRAHMAKADIYLFTSDRQEGWGAVLNEAMASGCAVVANRAIGSVPWLLEHGRNGLVYDTQEELYRCVEKLLQNEALRKRMARAATDTIQLTWNADRAAERLLLLLEELSRGGSPEVFSSGPCSSA